VRDYLARRDGESDRLTLISFDIAPGGYSKQTLLIGVAESRLLPDTFVIRKDHPAAIMQTSVCNEYPVLVQLHEAGLRVPQPLFLELSSEYLGAPFMAVARLAGRVEGAHLVAPADHGLARQLATELGRLHALECDRFAGLLPAQPSQSPDALHAEIELLRRYWYEFAHSESVTLAVAFRLAGEQHRQRCSMPGGAAWRYRLP
jgi:aminoglycoside phosphotransferase (APT) family kinase protein